VIYLDSAAVVKLVRAEPLSVDLVDWLGARTSSPLVSSALVEVEVVRVLRRSAPEALSRVPAVLARMYRVEIDTAVRVTAAAYGGPHLRSLDAIHLATASMLVGEPHAMLEAFVTYDRRLLAAADAAGLPTASPGG